MPDRVAARVLLRVGDCRRSTRLAAAVSERSPLSATGLAVVSTSEVVFALTTLTAIEPATPTLVPPAPEVACAEETDGLGAVVSTVVLPAVSVSRPPT